MKMHLKLKQLVWISIALFGTGLDQNQAEDLPVVSPTEVGMSADKLVKVETIVNDLIAKKRLAGASVMVARKGQVCFFETYGKMDVERDKEMQKDTIFRIYSMSKAITTAAVMQLIEQGKISPDDPIGKYIPELKAMTVFREEGIKPAKNPITVAQLMTHTAGLVYGAAGEYGKLVKKEDAINRDNTLQKMTQKMGQTPLMYEPGTDWVYGTSIDVLGRLIEVVSKQPFDKYLQDNIFTPLDMSDTGFFVPKEKQARFSANYKPGGELIDDPATSRYLKKPNLLSGGGGLVGTISDYMKFLIALRNGGQLNGKRILKPETIKLMTQNHVPKEVGWIKFGKSVRDGVGFGYGFSVCVEPSQFDSARKVGDYGWGGAASTHYWSSPKDDLIVVTMEQTMPFSFLLETALKPVISEAVEK
ncbi:serine hydrolase domain-containing protein [Gimesia aquarii]|uniref:Esterase EstB n=1 Tax=Gimesia aquarii TaxID=2527964 RepID=A0A517VVX7_9PLAN|nr:serine hydrolase domain-containing protein [Gimesia aquarii]QDT97159.1 Esterase EstB [Gimesia aquarii]